MLKGIDWTHMLSALIGGGLTYIGKAIWDDRRAASKRQRENLEADIKVSLELIREFIAEHWPLIQACLVASEFARGKNDVKYVRKCLTFFAPSYEQKLPLTLEWLSTKSGRLPAELQRPLQTLRLFLTGYLDLVDRGKLPSESKAVIIACIANIYTYEASLGHELSGKRHSEIAQAIETTFNSAMDRAKNQQ